MSISLYSEDGFVDDIASNGGYAGLLLYLQKVSGALKLKDFLRHGKTDEPGEVRKDIDYILGLGDTKINVSVSSVLLHLKEGMKSVEEVGIIS